MPIIVRPGLLAGALFVMAVAACADAKTATITPDVLPLLERTSELGWDCTRSSVDYGDSFSNGRAVTGTDSGFMIASCEAGDWGKPEAGVHLVPVGADGVVGESSQFSQGAQSTGDCQVAALGDGVAVAWREYAGADASEAIRWSSVDSLGAVIDGPTDLFVHEAGGYPFQLHRLIEAGDATGWLWSEPTGLRFQLADDKGTPQGTSSLLAAGYHVQPRGVRTPDGFLFTWTHDSGEGNEVFALATDHSGAPLGPPARFARATTEALWTSNGDLVALSDGSYLAAVSERVKRGEYPPSGDGWITDAWSTWPDGSLESTVLLQRLDSTGTPVGPLERLQIGVPHIENVDPSLAMVGDDVALTWSTGRVIYICGGCIRDNSLQLVLLDGTDLRPTSPVVDVPPDGVNGLYQPHLAASGSALAVTFGQDFHATTRTGWAHFGCAAR